MSNTHIIIINPDEMRWDAMGHMGNPAAHTPNLDRFMQEEAVSFSHAYCQNPVCVPSRCSFFTGLYPHVRGHRTMYHLLRHGESTLFSELKHAGYYVWMNARNDLVAAQYPELIRQHADEIFYAPPAEGQSKRREEGYSHYIGVTKTPGDSDQDEVDAACRFIEGYDNQKPMCLFLGLLNPHVPYQVEEEYRRLIDREKLTRCPKFEETKNKSLMLRKIHSLANLESMTEEDWQELRAVYLAQCSKVDAMFAQICGALKKKGIYDDCAIFFLSDHGDFCGDYGLVEKAENSFEDCLIRVPLLIKPPKSSPVDAGVSKSLVELVDFYATVMDYAAVMPDHTHFGKSLRPILENRSAAIREVVFAEGGRNEDETQSDGWHAEGQNGPATGNAYWPKLEAQRDSLAHEKGTAVFDGRYKYVHRPSGANEFYDLAVDPKELTNLYSADQSCTQVQILQMKLLAWYQRTCDTVPFHYDNRFTEEKIWSIVQRMCGGDPEKEKEVRSFIHEKQPTLMQAIGHVFAK